jgi:hypothetical protein
MTDDAKLPRFTKAGLLPPGDYELTLEELASSVLVVGPDERDSYPNWDAAWRGRLVENLGVMVHQLWPRTQPSGSAQSLDVGSGKSASISRLPKETTPDVARFTGSSAVSETTMVTSLSSPRPFGGRDAMAWLAAL